MNNNLPKGYTCACGAFNSFAVWVYAHWNTIIEGTCKNCGLKILYEGGLIRVGQKD